MDPKKFIAVTEGPPGLCPGLWSYYEFFSTLNEDDEEETNQGDWKGKWENIVTLSCASAIIRQ